MREILFVFFVNNKDELSNNKTQLEVFLESWSSSEFIFNSGEIITLSVTSVYLFSHIFRFDDKALSEFAVGFVSGEIKEIIFNAPIEPGECSFFVLFLDMLGEVKQES